MWSKPQCHKLYRSLKQLPIPEWPWNSIFIDFIKKLLSFSRFDIILVIVNWLTKQVIFILAHDTIMSTNLACLFVLHVFSKHSISSYIISDRGLEFVLNFFHSLGTALNMQLYCILSKQPLFSFRQGYALAWFQPKGNCGGLCKLLHFSSPNL